MSSTKVDGIHDKLKDFVAELTRLASAKARFIVRHGKMSQNEFPAIKAQGGALDAVNELRKAARMRPIQSHSNIAEIPSSVAPQMHTAAVATAIKVIAFDNQNRVIDFSSWKPWAEIRDGALKAYPEVSATDIEGYFIWQKPVAKKGAEG